MIAIFTMARISKIQQSLRVSKIISFTIKHGRMTVKDAVILLGVHRQTAGRYFHFAADTGKVVRYGNLGLFRDQRAIIDFDLVRYSYNKHRGEASCKK